MAWHAMRCCITCVDEYNLIIETRNSAVKNANAKLDLLDENNLGISTCSNNSDMM